MNTKLSPPSPATLAAWRLADLKRAEAETAKARSEAAILANASDRNPFGRLHRNLSAQAVIIRRDPDLADRLRAEAARAGA